MKYAFATQLVFGTALVLEGLPYSEVKRYQRINVAVRAGQAPDGMCGLIIKIFPYIAHVRKQCVNLWRWTAGSCSW